MNPYVLVITHSHVHVYNTVADEGHPTPSGCQEDVISTTTEVRGMFPTKEAAEVALPRIIQMHHDMSGYAPDYDYDPTGCRRPEYESDYRIVGEAVQLTEVDDF